MYSSMWIHYRSIFPYIILKIFRFINVDYYLGEKKLEPFKKLNGSGERSVCSACAPAFSAAVPDAVCCEVPKAAPSTASNTSTRRLFESAAVNSADAQAASAFDK